MFRTFEIPLSWSELFKRTVKETQNDDVLGLAAQLAYYFFLALFPALIFLIALASYLPGQVLQEALNTAGRFAPPEILTILREQISKIMNGQHGGLLTFGVAAALWSSSSAIVSVTSAMNRAYDIEEGRPWWKVRLVAIGLTLGLAVFLLLSFSLVLVGPTAADWLAGRFGFGPVFQWTWKIVQWPVAFALVVVGIAMLNYFAPDAEQDWEWITPGALMATVLWLIVSLGFKFYVENFGSYNETYGTVGGVMVLMLWFYLTGVAILVGSEMNAEIEHASPYGKDEGEKAPGQKKKLGAAAKRAYEAMRSKRGPGQGRATGQAAADRGAPARPGTPAPAYATATEAGRPSVWPGLMFFLASMMARLRRSRSTNLSA